MSWRVATTYSDYLFQLTRLLAAPLYYGVNVPHGDGQAVLLIPGFLAGDKTLTVMARWLVRIGYQVYFSGIRWNIDCPDRTNELLRARLDKFVQRIERPLIVIGHSLGGVLARALGAQCPQYVNHVVAIGSPIDGSMRVHPLVPVTFRTLQTVRKFAGRPLPPCARRLECTCNFTRTAFSSLPECVGFTAIFSPADEIVDWRACLDPRGTNQAVSGQHLGLIVNQEVYHIVAKTLASIDLSRRSFRGRAHQAQTDVHHIAA
jgi:triacylglycerol lipase